MKSLRSKSGASALVAATLGMITLSPSLAATPIPVPGGTMMSGGFDPVQTGGTSRLWGSYNPATHHMQGSGFFKPAAWSITPTTMSLAYTYDFMVRNEVLKPISGLPGYSQYTFDGGLGDFQFYITDLTNYVPSGSYLTDKLAVETGLPFVNFSADFTKARGFSTIDPNGRELRYGLGDGILTAIGGIGAPIFSTGATLRIDWYLAGPSVNQLSNNTTFQATLVAAPLAGGAVPESSTWAMMIVGFGLVGASSRYRRRATKICFA
jgi:hypothetical protein